MDTLSYKTKFANKENSTQNWHLVDAEGEVLGRLSSKIANLVRGKYKPDFTEHFNSGDKVVVINAEKIRLTGKKWTDKKYIRHTGYPGGIRKRTAKQLLEVKPTELIIKAVKGMLPKNKLQKQYLKNLHVYVGTNHPHVAQNPQKIEIN
ncbi:MAG: 50S ribosomal protein L13 [Bacteroidota bacterium]|nr:50S ribosomal protein L13 [Bacteroidota bacterium]